MAKVISTLDDAVQKLNSLYEGDSTPPEEGSEDYVVWTDLLNLGINIWENEEGMLWRELYVKLEDAPDGDKTTTASDYSYSVPTLFSFPSSKYVWLGSGSNKIPFKVIDPKDVQLYENDSSNWCYFLQDGTPTLEFNPNCTLPEGATINYNYYKTASAVEDGTDTFEMKDPMFAVYYALSELKKEEGDTSALTIATQKLDAMKTKNMMGTDWGGDDFMPRVGNGMGI